MSKVPNTPPKLTPDGKPFRQRRGTDETDRSIVDEAQDPEIPGDANRPGYGNTDEARPNADGLVRNGEDREPPLI